jgi:5'-deoxynucleotidase YfbR-like HD superfamily hydrolase
MELEEITKEFVLSEVAKLQYLYKLKTEIRYDQVRDDEGITESVAEHIYGMHVLALYFLPLIDPDRELKRDRVYEMITLHDIDEIETGDVIGYLKSEADRSNEAIMAKKVVASTPLHMQADLLSTIDEYEKQESIESRFVKAIDKFEPLVHLYNTSGKQIVTEAKSTATNSSSIREKYLEHFPIMFSYYKVIHQAMIEEGFFHPEN